MHRPAGRPGMGAGRDAGVPHLDHAAGPRLRRGLRAAHGRAGRDRRRGRDHPHRGRMRRQFPQRKPPDAGAAGRRAGRTGGGPGVRRGSADRGGAGGDGGRIRGRGRRGHRDDLPGVQGRHRDRVPDGAGRGDRRRGHDDQLRRPGTAHGSRGAGRAAAAGSRCRSFPPGARPAWGQRRPPGPRRLVHRGGAHRRAAGRGRLPAAGPPGRAGPGPGRQHRAPRQRGNLPGPGHRAARAPGGRPVPVPHHRERAGRLLRRRGRGHRGGRAEQPAASRDGHRPGWPHLLRAARRTLRALLERTAAGNTAVGSRAGRQGGPG